MYAGYNAASPLNTGVLDTWTSTNSCTVMMGHEFGDNTAWTSFENGTNFPAWDAWVAAVPGRSFGYSCPLLVAANAQDYTGLNAGTYDSHFVNIGNALQGKTNLRNAIIRLGWEFNGNTFPWQIPANSTDAQLTAYKNGFNRAAGIIKGQCPTVQFEWCPNAHLDNANRTLADMYPGDTYVDYVGLAVYDYYWPGGTPSDATRNNWILNDTNGMNDQKALATAHGKPIAYTEWGLWTTANTTGGGDRPSFMTMMLDFMRDNNVAYTQYNNVNAQGNHKLDNWPNAKAIYVSRLATGALTG